MRYIKIYARKTVFLITFFVFAGCTPFIDSDTSKVYSETAVQYNFSPRAEESSGKEETAQEESEKESERLGKKRLEERRLRRERAREEAEGKERERKKEEQKRLAEEKKRKKAEEKAGRAVEKERKKADRLAKKEKIRQEKEEKKRARREAAQRKKSERKAKIEAKKALREERRQKAKAQREAMIKERQARKRERALEKARQRELATRKRLDKKKRVTKWDLRRHEKDKMRVKSLNTFDEGMDYYDMGEYKVARYKFTEALSIDPKNKMAAGYSDKADREILADRRIDKKERAKKKKERAKRRNKLERRSWGLFGSNEIGLKNLLDDIPATNLPGQKLTIQQCIDIGLANSVQLDIAEKQIKLAKIRLWESRRKLAPTIKGKWEESSGKISGRRYEGRKLLAEYSQPVFHGGELLYTVGQAEVNLEIVENDYDRIKNEVILQVEKAYYSMDKAIKSSRIQENLYRQAKDLNDSTKGAFDAGAVSKVEYLNVYSKYNQINFQYSSSKEDVELARLILKQAMNTEADISIFGVDDPVTKDISIDDCYTLAFANRPEMKINFLMTEYYLYEKRINQAKGWPKVDLSGAWGYSEEDFVEQDRIKDGVNYNVEHKFLPEWHAGVTVSVPVFGSTAGYTYTREKWQPVVSTTHGTEAITHTTTFDVLNNLKHYSDVAESDVDFSRAQHEYNDAKQKVIMEIQEAFFKYKKALLQMEVARTKVEFQRNYVTFLDTKRQMNETPASNVIEEMIKQGEEEFSLLQAIADYYMAVKSLNKAIGIIGYF